MQFFEFNPDLHAKPELRLCVLLQSRSVLDQCELNVHIVLGDLKLEIMLCKAILVSMFDNCIYKGLKSSTK